MRGRIVAGVAVAALLAFSPARAFARTQEPLCAGIQQQQRASSVKINVFVLRLFNDFKASYSRLREVDWNHFCNEAGVSCSDEEAKTRFLLALFIHDLVKKDGALGAVFSQKHVDRPSARVASSKKTLEQLGASECFRHPSLSLRDLLAESPRYLVSGTPAFALMDWGEFETTYSSLLASLGVQSRITVNAVGHLATLVEIKPGAAMLEVDNYACFFEANVSPSIQPSTGGELGFETLREARDYVTWLNSLAKPTAIQLTEAQTTSAKTRVQRFLEKERPHIPE